MNKKFIGLITVLVICVCTLTYNTYSKKENLINNGKHTIAVIENITTNRIDNELSPTVENIHIKYKYEINDEEFSRTQEISRHEHDLYFSETGKKGDSLTITYDSKNPINSQIEKIK